MNSQTWTPLTQDTKCLPSTEMTENLIFPELATNFNQTLQSLKKATLSTHNRLKSIIDDSRFVCEVSDAYGYPLIANERCGSWYIPPEHKEGSAYFKSTDGHMGIWSFSSRRLNLQILDIVASRNG
jgi:tRNA A64-2'-O-ribosylphosphate transferase